MLCKQRILPRSQVLRILGFMRYHNPQSPITQNTPVPQKEPPKCLQTPNSLGLPARILRSPIPVPPTPDYLYGGPWLSVSGPQQNLQQLPQGHAAPAVRLPQVPAGGAAPLPPGGSSSRGGYPREGTLRRKTPRCECELCLFKAQSCTTCVCVCFPIRLGSGGGWVPMWPWIPLLM